MQEVEQRREQLPREARLLDFSHYLLDYPGAFFGLGSGIDQPQLHNEYYDFPDELIPTGVKIYLSIIDAVFEAWSARHAPGTQ